MLFSFYNGQLFRIVVYYAWDRTEGMTAEDVVGALAVTYGPANLPAADSSAAVPWGYTSSDRIIARWDSDRVMAHWDNAQHSLSVVRPSYASTFGLVMFSKPLDALARAASAEAPSWTTPTLQHVPSNVRQSKKTRTTPGGRRPATRTKRPFDLEALCREATFIQGRDEAKRQTPQR